ncbi:DnaT-like ssDNA-binding protein [Rhodobium gokarnense]|uniref:Putative DnaT-like domain-containing protein n=1 Tax=Rhodobium gokarnense TaxID=364296 RepID=A0ABT3HH99_9HYPH|nr:DnaT-like ssDNA-binding protein [Rhodobium gokarnense]MCW2309719.1 hypothetical protein [Rhodobium gokarnense]
MTIDVTAKSATAVAYGSAAEADAYFTARAITTWTGTDAAKEAALIRGCDYLEGKYRGRWEGLATTEAQSLSWPRGYICDVDGYSIDADTVPNKVKYANFEAALLILTGADLEPALERGGAPIMERVKAGPVETETEYSAGAPARSVFTKIEGLLVGLVKNQNTVELARV